MDFRFLQYGAGISRVCSEALISYGLDFATASEQTLEIPAPYCKRLVSLNPENLAGILEIARGRQATSKRAAPMFSHTCVDALGGGNRKEDFCAIPGSQNPKGTPRFSLADDLDDFL